MSAAVPLPPPGFDELPVDEQIDYDQSLWDRIAARPEDVHVPEWHREVLAQRLRRLSETSDSGELWSVVRDRIREKLRGAGR